MNITCDNWWVEVDNKYFFHLNNLRVFSRENDLEIELVLDMTKMVKIKYATKQDCDEALAFFVKIKKDYFEAAQKGCSYHPIQDDKKILN